MAPRHTLLVVDDEPDVVQSVQDLLRRQFRVLGATRAEDGLRLLRENEVHVVMSDQRMPGVSGVEFLARVRAERPDAIRLLFTGYADLKAVIDAINEGHVYRYITKPWDPEELQAILRQAAEQYDLLAERKRLLADLQSRNEQLQKANAELKESNALKEAFIRVASHELRTPLTILMGLPEMALRIPGLPAPVAEWFRRTLAAAQRMHRLVEQLLQMLRAGRFERPLLRRPADLEALVRESVDDVRPFAEQRRLELVLDLAPGLGTLDVDGAKIRDCLNHLLLNAIKFTPDGGRVEVSARRTPAGDAELRVRDNGVGIDAENMAHLFEPFFTERDVSKHSSGHFEFLRRGLGLGLSVVRAFVAMHGGKVEVASEPGRGTAFTITLPGRAPAERGEALVGEGGGL
jgi:two-component system, response regulator PhcR